jgi:hypothetical protein
MFEEGKYYLVRNTTVAKSNVARGSRKAPRLH